MSRDRGRDWEADRGLWDRDRLRDTDLRGDARLLETDVTRGRRDPRDISTHRSDDMRLYSFSCEMGFSHHKSPNPTLVTFDESGIRRQVLRNPSRMQNHINALIRVGFNYNDQLQLQLQLHD